MSVIEMVDRFSSKRSADSRAVQDDRREERSLEAVRTAVSHDSSETAQGRATVRFLVVRQAIEIALNIERRLQPRDQPSLAR
jgi:hypothetical protein